MIRPRLDIMAAPMAIIFTPVLVLPEMIANILTKATIITIIDGFKTLKNLSGS